MTARPPSLFITIGPPGAGKTTFVSWALVAGHLVSPADVLNPDALLFEGSRYKWSPERVGQAWQKVKSDFKSLLSTGRNIALDATFVRRQDRREFIQAARAAGYTVIAVYFDVPAELLVERDRMREDAGKRVGVNIIHRFFTSSESPDPAEGFDEIWRIDQSGRRCDI